LVAPKVIAVSWFLSYSTLFNSKAYMISSTKICSNTPTHTALMAVMQVNKG